MSILKIRGPEPKQEANLYCAYCRKTTPQTLVLGKFLGKLIYLCKKCGKEN